jgi:hypothetical protein
MERKGMRAGVRERKGPTSDRREDALHGAHEDRPALVLPEPRREAADVGEGGDGDHPPLEGAQDEELHPQHGRAVERELARVQRQLRQPRSVVLLQLGRQRHARHHEQLQTPRMLPLNPTVTARDGRGAQPVSTSFKHARTDGGESGNRWLH